MEKESALDIIKGAILLEEKGKLFYQNSADNVSSQSMKDLLHHLAEEEQKHKETLLQQYKTLQKGEKLSDFELKGKALDVDKKVLSSSIKEEVQAADYEAAVISAAIALEDKAIEYYSEKALATDDPVANELFRKLAEWEKQHKKYFAELDEELQKDIWYDNHFWPVI